MEIAITLLTLGEIALAFTVFNILDRQLRVIKLLIEYRAEMKKLEKQQEKEKGKDERV